ncbi:MFS transporter [Nonomuraea rhodomycinica]|uniref:MFS transporter n=1 Tax=Nonomuraea rhodomycinica TaxID=1712872 RepID=A0A7Y6IIB9_9ACTN|nr:MFS transporter [Nonomuraea rhodomycinica]NUW38667.1 MFS transporter [Nonomuraea rhodomycinica]
MATVPNRWWALPVVLVAVFMTTLDFFIANVAVPSMRAGLPADGSEAQLVIAGYGLAYAAGLVVAGRLGDLHGPRRVFSAGLALFTLASAACGAAPGAWALILARVLQGVAAALLAPQVLTLLGGLYRGADRARAFGWYGTAVGLAGVSGQVIGGLLIAADPWGLGWRACFLVNVPLGLVALAATPRLVPSPPPPSTHLPAPQSPPPSNHVPAPQSPPTSNHVPAPAPSPTSNRPPLPHPSPTRRSQARAGGARPRAGLDVAGAGMVAAGLVAVVLPLAQGREQGWPVWTWLCLATSAPLLATFARRQRRLAAAGRQPLLDLDVFGEKGFAGGLVAVALLFGGSAGLSFVLALYLQEGLRLGPAAAGAVCTALNGGFLAGSARTAALTRRLGTRAPLTGAATLLLGLLLLDHVMAGAGGIAGAGGAVAYQVAGALLVTGAGMGLLMSPLISTTLARVRPERSGAAAGVLGTVQEMGGVLGGTLTGTVLLGSLESGWGTAARAGLAVPAACALGVLAVAALAVRRTTGDRQAQVDDRAARVCR